MKNEELRKQAYASALAVLSGSEKRAGIWDYIQSLPERTLNFLPTAGKYYLGWRFGAPILAATGGGLLLGAALNKLQRRADPTIADDNTKDDIRRVERLRRIQYYNNLSRQIESLRKDKEEK